MAVKWARLAVAMLATVAMSGCLWDVPDPEEEVKDHVLLLHDITYEWNQSQRELSGHFILSNTHESEDVMMSVLLIDSRFSEDGGYSNPNVGNGLEDAWSLGYDDYQKVIIKPGESMVFNYTFPEQSRFKNNSIDWTPNHIYLNLQSRYYYHNSSEITDENPNGWESVNSDYNNDCLDVVNGILVLQTMDRCNPWEPWDFGGFGHEIGRLRFPPPEVWPTWTDDSPIPLSDHPYLRKHVKFLQDFDYESANIVYFEGEID